MLISAVSGGSAGTSRPGAPGAFVREVPYRRNRVPAIGLRRCHPSGQRTPSFALPHARPLGRGWTTFREVFAGCRPCGGMPSEAASLRLFPVTRENEQLATPSALDPKGGRVAVLLGTHASAWEKVGCAFVHDQAPTLKQIFSTLCVGPISAAAFLDSAIAQNPRPAAPVRLIGSRWQSLDVGPTSETVVSTISASPAGDQIEGAIAFADGPMANTDDAAVILRFSPAATSMHLMAIRTER